MREILGHEVLIEVQQEWEQWDVNANNEMSNVLWKWQLNSIYYYIIIRFIQFQFQLD